MGYKFPAGMWVILLRENDFKVILEIPLDFYGWFLYLLQPSH